jgi:flagellar hook-length control protein FliK
VASVPSPASIHLHSFQQPERNNAPDAPTGDVQRPFSVLLDAGTSSPEPGAAAGNTASKAADTNPASADKQTQPSDRTKDQSAGAANQAKAANSTGSDPKPTGQATADTTGGTRRPSRAKSDAATGSTDATGALLTLSAAAQVTAASGAQTAIVAGAPVSAAVGSPPAQASNGSESAAAISAASAPTAPAQPSAPIDAAFAAAASVSPASSPQAAAPAPSPVAPTNSDRTVVPGDTQSPSRNASGVATLAPPQLLLQQPPQTQSPGGAPIAPKPQSATVNPSAPQSGPAGQIDAAAVSVATAAAQTPLVAKEVTRPGNGPGGAATQKSADNNSSNAPDETVAINAGPTDAPARDAPPPADGTPAAPSEASISLSAAAISVEPRQNAAARIRDAEQITPDTTSAPSGADASAAATSAGTVAAALSAPTSPAAVSANAAPAVAASAAVPLGGLAVEIAARALAGKNRFDISLDPPELGRINVRLEVDRNGAVTSHVVADRADTLNLLRRDAPDLQRALQDAGLKTSDNALQFSLRDQGFAGRDQQSRDGAATAPLVIPDAAPARAEASAVSYGRSLAGSSGIDIRV